MAKQKTVGTVTHTPTIKGTSIGRHPITSTMNKHKRRTNKKERCKYRYSLITNINLLSIPIIIE